MSKWKQEIDLGTRNNQNFASIPHTQFIHMLTYKAEMVGIKVIVTGELYQQVLLSGQ
jgi:putative transposase